MNDKVAISYFQPIPNSVRVGIKTYSFETRRGISLAWIDQSDVQIVLEVTKECCGGQLRHPYRLANEAQIRIWEGTAER